MKKSLLLFFIIVFMAGMTKFYFHADAIDKLERISIISPSSSASANGIIKLSAKFVGKPSNVKFTVKNERNEKIKSVNAFSEFDSGEWVYYLNSMELENGDYKLETYASSSDKSFSASQDIKIYNAGVSSSSKLTAAVNPPAAPRPTVPQEENKIADSPSNTPAEPRKDLEAEIENRRETPENKIPDDAARKNERLPDEILNGVVKALSGVYDAINGNLLASNLNFEPPAQSETPQGKIAGATARKEPEKVAEVNKETRKSEEAKKEEKKNTDDYGWFKYDLKISNIENNEIITSEKLLNAKCNNPLDSVEFILDNLNTPDIDYTFNGVNNYGYYTYWTYKINPRDLKKGEYLLYAKGAIDWHTYESPIIVIKIE